MKKRYRYLTSGLVIVDEVYPYGASQPSFVRLGGGGTYALSAFRLWTDECALAAYVGADFGDLFGQWMQANGCTSECLQVVVDHTSKSHLAYQKNGTYIPLLYGGRRIGLYTSPNMQLMEPCLHSGLKGVHILMNGEVSFFEQLNRYRKKYGFKVGFEIANPPDAPSVAEMIQEVTSKYIDYFSLSFVEAQQYYPGIRDKQDALELCLSLPCPVYFRMGTDGAYMVKDGHAHLTAMVDEFETADPTGCGNTSTAAAFWALCENKSIEEIGVIASITASLNARSFGLIPVIEPWMRERCVKYVAEHSR